MKSTNLISSKKAVALKYPKGAEAPFVVAKGNGKLADIILLEAEKSNVPIEENTPLVNFLENVELGSLVPEESWEILAQIFSFILSNEE